MSEKVELSTPVSLTPIGTSKSDLTEAMVRLWRTTLLRSPLISAVPDRSVNFDCCRIERSASVDGDQVDFCLRRQRSPRVARMLATNVRRSGWSGWVVASELASPRAESADWAAVMVAAT